MTPEQELAALSDDAKNLLLLTVQSTPGLSRDQGAALADGLAPLFNAPAAPQAPAQNP